MGVVYHKITASVAAIETFYNYFKNKAGYNSLYAEDYYKTQGLAFMMLVSALIHQKMEAAIADINRKSVISEISLHFSSC